MQKETWTPDDLETLAAFVSNLQEHIQQTTAGNGIRVKDLLVVIEDENVVVGASRQNWGLITLRDREDTVIQFEPLNVEIGVI